MQPIHLLEYEDDIGHLVSWGLEQRIIEGCDGFVVKPADCVAVFSLDELALDYLVGAESKSEAHKLLCLQHFKSELLGPREDSKSFTPWILNVGSVGFVICVVVVEGHEPVAIDYFAVHEVMKLSEG